MYEVVVTKGTPPLVLTVEKIIIGNNTIYHNTWAILHKKIIPVLY